MLAMAQTRMVMGTARTLLALSARRPTVSRARLCRLWPEDKYGNLPPIQARPQTVFSSAFTVHNHHNHPNVFSARSVARWLAILLLPLSHSTLCIASALSPFHHRASSRRLALVSVVPAVLNMPPPSSSHSAPFLDYDALGHVMIALEAIGAPNSDLLCFMRTNKSMYHIGTKVLLDRGVVLDSNRAVASFALFLSAHNFTRAGMFEKSLTIKSSTLSETAARVLSVILRHVVYLHKLVIHDADVLFDLYPNLFKVLARMTRLRHLELEASRSTGHVMAFLRNLRSELLTVTLLFPQPEAPKAPVWKMDTCDVLSRSQSTMSLICPDERLSFGVIMD